MFWTTQLHCLHFEWATGRDKRQQRSMSCRCHCDHRHWQIFGEVDDNRCPLAKSVDASSKHLGFLNSDTCLAIDMLLQPIMCAKRHRSVSIVTDLGQVCNFRNDPMGNSTIVMMQKIVLWENWGGCYGQSTFACTCMALQWSWVPDHHITFI